MNETVNFNNVLNKAKEEQAPSEKRYKCFTVEHVEGLFQFQYYQGMINDGTTIAYEKQTKECLGPIKAYVGYGVTEMPSLWTLYDYSTEAEKNFCVKACLDTEDPYLAELEQYIQDYFIAPLEKQSNVTYLKEHGEVVLLTKELTRRL